MRRRAFTVLEMLVVLVIVGILAVILFPVFARPRDGHGRSSCQSNLKQMALGIKQYVYDYNERYPRVNVGKNGWMDLVQPYLKSVQLFQCPQESKVRTNGTTDYFYNARVAGQEEAKFYYIANTIMNADGTGNAPTNFSLTTFPKAWASDSNSPAWRHYDGANYSFADGHVKWLRPAFITNEKANSSNHSFAPW